MSNRQLIAVDIGNQRIKFGLMPRDLGSQLATPSAVFTWHTKTLEFDRLLDRLPGDTLDWCVATVHRNAESKLAAWVKRHRPRDDYRCIKNKDLPIDVQVDFPEAVGTDRLLAAVAVNRLRDPQHPAVIVDAGTAITVDLVSADGIFEGGVILPGFATVARALALEADQLPLIDQPVASVAPAVVGKSTAAAIESGLFWGNVGAVRELIARMTHELPSPPQLFFAGGDAEHLAEFIAPDARIIRELVFAGIAIAHGAK